MRATAIALGHVFGSSEAQHEAALLYGLAASKGGNSASHAWASAPTYCPPQYTRVSEGESGPIYSCDYTGAVSVSVQGAPFARTWWTMNGDTVTEFSPAAKAQLGTWDTRFDDDYAAWLAALPPPAPPTDSGS